MDELEPGTVRAVRVGGVDLAVMRSGDTVTALRDTCTHQGALLSNGKFGGTILPDPERVGRYTYGRAREILRCPWHRWEFDVGSGRSLHDPERKRMKVYPVVEEQGDLYVEMVARQERRPVPY